MSVQAVGDAADRFRAAVEAGDAEMLREALRQNPELRARINEPMFAFDSPAMMHARSAAMVDALLEAGADINGRSGWWAGSFGLMDFAEGEFAEYAIARGAVVDVHAAARLGRMDRLRELMTADAGAVRARGGDGQTPLHFAKDVEVAEFLLGHGAEIDAIDVDHESTAAQYALRDRQGVAKYLVSRGCRTDLLMAAALGDVELVRRHLDADPACIRLSVTASHFPMRDPRAGGTIYIWKLGANKTAHRVAREFGHEEVLAVLMERTPMEMKLAQACELGDEEAFNALLASRPGLAAGLTEDDQRKLPNAAQESNLAAVRLMLKAGWPVDARGQHGGTALHWAAWHGNVAIVRELLAYKPSIEDAGNDFNGTPLGWAMHGSENGWHRRTGDYVGVVELLRGAGAEKPGRVLGTEGVREAVGRS